MRFAAMERRFSLLSNAYLFFSFRSREAEQWVVMSATLFIVKIVPLKNDIANDIENSGNSYSAHVRLHLEIYHQRIYLSVLAMTLKNTKPSAFSLTFNPWLAKKGDALQYKVKMYDGLMHGVFFVNNTWADDAEDEVNHYLFKRAFKV